MGIKTNKTLMVISLITLVSGCYSPAGKHKDSSEFDVYVDSAEVISKDGNQRVFEESELQSTYNFPGVSVENPVHSIKGGDELFINDLEPFAKIHFNKTSKLSKSSKNLILSLDRANSYRLNGYADYLLTTWEMNEKIAINRLNSVYEFMSNNGFSVEKGHAQVVGKKGSDYRMVEIMKVVK